jgi:UDP-N-acetyl-2-amino-2-deoxyglucuronate dehydrogenase
VDIVTHNHLHADIGIMAANAKKHVLVEKPIDISIEKADKLIEACRKNGVALSVIAQKRFDDGIRKIKSMIDAGELGKVFLAKASVRWRRTQGYYEDSGGWKKKAEYAGGGVFMYQAIHFVDVLLWLLGPAESVFGETITATHSIGVEDTGAAVIRFESGAIGCIDATTSVKCNIPDRLEIYGEKGSIVLERNRFTGWSFSENPIVSLLSSHVKSVAPMKLGSVGDQIEDFARAIEASEKPTVSGEEGKAALRVVLAFYESARTGKMVRA